MDGVSVLICCHNGAARIGPTIEVLADVKRSFPPAVPILLQSSIEACRYPHPYRYRRVDPALAPEAGAEAFLGT